MKLPIVLQKHFTSVFQYALPLCAIMSQPMAERWFYQHYMSIIGKESSNHSIWFWYPDSFDYLSKNKANNMFDLSMSTMNDVNKKGFFLNNFIIENLENKRYLIVFVDEFYISSSLKYKKVHYFHEYLVYGFDEIKRNISCIGFDSRNTYCQLEINADEFNMGFHAILEKDNTKDSFINNNIIISFLVPDFSNISIAETNRNIQIRMLEYAGSIYNTGDNKIFEQFFYQDDNVQCGFHSINLLIRAFEYLLSRNDYLIDIRQILMIYEVRNSIYIRWKQLLVTTEDFILWEKFKEVINGLKSIYMDFIKNSFMITGEGFEVSHQSILHIEDKFVKMKMRLEYIKNIEGDILEKFIEDIKV